MSRADEIYRATCLDILENGFYDTDQQVRPHWADGTPAHTVKKFGVVNRYNLAEEFPIMTLRRTYWKSAVDELLWIWQKKSNRIADLAAMYGTSGQVRMVPLARHTVISWASSTLIKRVCLIRWTG